jgi:hypothetical protein
MAKRPAPRATRAAARIAKAGERLNTRIEKRATSLSTKKAPKLAARQTKLQARVDKREAAGKKHARADRKLARVDTRIARVDARRQALLGLLGRGTTSPVAPPRGPAAPANPFDPGAAGRGLPVQGPGKQEIAARIAALPPAPAPVAGGRTGPLAGGGFNPYLDRRKPHGSTIGTPYAPYAAPVMPPSELPPGARPPIMPVPTAERLPPGVRGGGLGPRSTQTGIVSRPTTPDQLSRPFTDPVRR